MGKEYYLADNIDLNLITPEEFEKLIYFLLDEMGMKNIEWRKGGEGISATDGGRDLECEFYNLYPDGTMRKERWWVEVKYRSKTLQTSKVQEVILNALGVPELDVIIIVTNTSISNKARDWIKNLSQQAHPKRVIIWEGHQMERLICSHPTIIYKFFPTALTLNARLKSTHQRFLSQLALPSATELSDFWKNRKSLDFSFASILSIIFAENSFGDIEKRKWGLWLPDEHLMYCLALGFRNILPWSLKCKEFGREDNFMIHGLAYLLQCSLLRFEAKTIKEVVERSYKDIDDKLQTPISKEYSKQVLKIILTDCLSGLAGACSQDCPKLKFFYDEVDKRKLFYKFINEKFVDGENGALYFCSTKHECKIGLVPIQDRCPFTFDVTTLLSTDERLFESLEFIREVLLRNVRLLSKKKKL